MNGMNLIKIIFGLYITPYSACKLFWDAVRSTQCVEIEWFLFIHIFILFPVCFAGTSQIRLHNTTQGMLTFCNGLKVVGRRTHLRRTAGKTIRSEKEDWNVDERTERDRKRKEKTKNKTKYKAVLQTQLTISHDLYRD
jgi:hypothetical protein